VESYQKELKQIKEILKNSPKGMTVTDISREMHTNRNSVAKYLDVLLISGQAEMVTFGPAKVFFPSRRIPLSALLNFTSDSIVMIDRDFRVIQVNDNFLEFIDLDREYILNVKIDTSSLPFFSTSELIENIQDALDGKESIREIQLLLQDTTPYIRIRNIPTTFDNGEPGVTLIIEDITEQKMIQDQLLQSNKEWEMTFNSITEMVTIQDENYVIRKANKAFASFFDGNPEDFIGKKCYELIHDLQEPHELCPCKKALKKKKPHQTEFFEPHLDAFLHISTSPIFSQEGRFSGSVHIMKDITKKKE